METSLWARLLVASLLNSNERRRGNKVIFNLDSVRSEDLRGGLFASNYPLTNQLNLGNKLLLL